MTDERWKYLSDHMHENLTEAEMAEGWHWCYEFDGLLVQGDPKVDVCGPSCYKRDLHDYAGTS